MKHLIWIVSLLLLLVSCEKMFMETDAGTDPETIFDEVWTFADRHYSFFEEKGVDWDEKYEQYRQEIHPDMGPVELFDVCAAMLHELRDGHVNLSSSFDRSRSWEWYLDSPENFYYSIIERNYFEGRQRYVGPLQFVALEDNIAYVYYGSFANTIGESNLDLIISSLEDAAGLIIDVRNNGGGSTDNARKLVSRFIETEQFVGTSYIKNGPGHEDFKAQKVHIEPYDGIRYDGHVVVLTNRKSYSATNYFAQYMKTVDNVTLVGDTTGGGGGIPAFWELPNSWRLRVSSSRFVNPEGQSIESGVPPDIYAEINTEGDSLSLQKDDILEKGMDQLRDNTK